MSTVAALKPKSEVPLDEAALRRIVFDPFMASYQLEGICYRVMQVRAPKECTPQMVADRPDLWRRIQVSPKALRRLDEVRVLAYDETWMLTAVVGGATAAGVSLAPKTIKVFELPARTENLPGDENYQVNFVGSGYAVIRRNDGQQMGETVATIPLAEMQLRRCYPQKAEG